MDNKSLLDKIGDSIERGRNKLDDLTILTRPDMMRIRRGEDVPGLVQYLRDIAPRLRRQAVEMLPDKLRDEWMGVFLDAVVDGPSDSDQSES